MKLFDAVPSDLFSVLASPNRALYSDALDVLYTAYRENLKIPERTLYTMLRGRLEQQLAEASFDGEDIDEDELRDVSGRARFLIRKLCAKGWFEKERGDNFEEYINVPGYSSRLLEILHQLRSDEPIRGYAYVYGTYSMLKVAQEDDSVYNKMNAVYNAYDNTQALINLLQMVYHNVKHFFQLQMQMRQVNQVLASHFDDFGQKVAEAYIRPLKIRDSVPKYRGPIQDILNRWLEDDALIAAMADTALQDRRGTSFEACRADLLQKIFWVKDRYDSLEQEYLDEIDSQVRRYTRATTQKLENLTTRDQTIRGNLLYLMDRLADPGKGGDTAEAINPALGVYEQSFLSDKSLWYRKRPGKRTKSPPTPMDETGPGAQAMARAQSMLHSDFDRKAVAAYVQSLLSETGECASKDMDLKDDKAYIMSLLAVLTGGSPGAAYTVEALDGSYEENGYTIPQLLIRSKEEQT